MINRKILLIFKTVPILLFCTVVYSNIYATEIENNKSFSLPDSSVYGNDCQNECFAELTSDNERTWSRARERMWDCVDQDFYEALLAVLPESGSPIIDMWQAIESVAGTFPSIWEAYGCLDFMETQMNLELGQVTGNYTDCVLFRCY